MDQDYTELEFFQDLTIYGDPTQLDATKSAILATARGGSAAGWSVVPEDQTRRATPTDDVIALERAGDEVAEASDLFMVRRGSQYDLTNIVPVKTGQLGRSRYNAILQDFVARIASPVVKQTGARLELSSPTHTMEEYLGAEAARALRRFSTAANMSTGSSHPLDRQRWYDFKILVRDKDVDAGTLGRWLMALGWPEDIAHSLASEFEFGYGLLHLQRDQAV